MDNDQTTNRSEGDSFGTLVRVLILDVYLSGSSISTHFDHVQDAELVCCTQEPVMLGKEHHITFLKVDFWFESFWLDDQPRNVRGEPYFEPSIENLLILDELFMTSNLPAGLLSLFRPICSLFGVKISRASTWSSKSLMPSGRSFIQFAVLAQNVSHCKIDRRSLETDFSMDALISRIFLSTRPFMLCPPTGHVSSRTWLSVKSFSWISW